MTIPDGLDGLNITSINIPESVEVIESGALTLCPNLKTVTINNRNCEIRGFAETICNTVENVRVSGKTQSVYHFDGVIQGYKGSTAEEYAKQFGYNFEVLPEPVTTTTVTTTTTITTTTTTVVTSTSPYDIIASGSCGDKATWQLNRMGSLNIKGKGEITSAPWKSNYQSIIKDVDIEEGITKICPEAFSYCSALEDVRIPDSVTIICGKAFEHTPSLDSISIPNGVNQILLGTFYGSGISRITIPDSVSYIGPTSFSYCKNLRELVLPASVGSIDRAAFDRCSALQITILNPDCSINQTSETLFCHSITGYRNSTADKYADYFNKTFIELEAPKKASFGDPNGDRKIDANDASLVLVEYSKMSTGAATSLTSEQTTAADVNKDGKVDSKDASAMLAYYSYLSTGGDNDLEVFLSKQ